MSRKFILSLSSGGSLGYAHIGVLKAFIESGIDILAISGTSMGGIVSSLFALGISPYDIEDVFVSIMSNISVFSSAALSHIGVHVGPMAFLHSMLKGIKIGHSRIPLFVYATDMYTRKPYLFQPEDDMFTALRATSAIPGIFPPVKYKGMYLVDGGIALPLPSKDLMKYKTPDVVSVGIEVYGGTLMGIRHSRVSIMHAYSLIMSRHGRCRGGYLDYIISPNLRGYTNLMYGKVREIVERGYIAGISFLEGIYRKGLL
jgi:NTE family protein